MPIVNGEVTDLTIAQVISEKIGVPLEVVTGHLEGVTQSRLVGQDEAMDRVCQSSSWLTQVSLKGVVL